MFQHITDKLYRHNSDNTNFCARAGEWRVLRKSRLQQDSKILQKTWSEHEASKQFNHRGKISNHWNKNDTKLKVYPFDKGSEFDIMKEQEDILKSNIIHYD